MNVNRPSKSRLTIRGIVFTLTGIFIGIPLLACLWIEYSLSSDLSQQLAKVQQSRERLRQSTSKARELKERFDKERTHAYWHERHIVDLLDQCRHIKDLPNIQSEFIICHQVMNEPDSATFWILIPEGNHKLQVKLTESNGTSLTDEQVFSYSLLANSGYKLRLSVPGPPYESMRPGAKPIFEPTPIVLALESNNPEFKAVEETLPVNFYRRVATQHFHSSSQQTGLVLRFPSECYGERLQFKESGMILPKPDFVPTTRTAQLGGFAWHMNRDNRSTPSNSMFVSIEVSSDAPACAAPYFSIKPEDQSKFQPYSGRGRFLPLSIRH